MSAIEQLQIEGRKAAELAKEDPRGALAATLSLLEHDWLLDYEGYDEWLMTAGTCLERLGEPAAAALCWLGREDLSGTLSRLPIEVAAKERAVVLERAGRDEEAARLFGRLGCWARAARVYEKAGRFEEALDAWVEAIAAAPEDADPVGWTFGHLGLAQLLHEDDDADSAREPLRIGLIGLARLAVDAEEAGDLWIAAERYRVLATIGAHTHQLEHLLEGAVHLARLLEAEGDALGALEARLGAARACERAKAPQAAATFWQEAAELSEAHWPLLTSRLWRYVAEAWDQAADHLLSAGLMPELAENALLARIDALNKMGDDPAIAASFRRLSALDLSERDKARYVRLAVESDRAARRASEASERPLDLRFRLAGDDDLWAAELLRRELGHDLRAALMDLTVWARSPIGRRRALRCLLRTFLDDEAQRQEGALSGVRLLARNVNRVLAQQALVHLAGEAATEVRVAALEALAPVTRSDVTRLLVDSLRTLNEAVAQAAYWALSVRPRKDAVGLLVRAARSGNSRESEMAVDLIGALGADATALDALFDLSHEPGAVGVAAKARFEAICPERLRAVFTLRDRHAP